MNELRHAEEFNKVLASYKMSASAVKTLAETKLVLLVAPTSSGRNTIIRELLKTGRFHYIVSDTTRQPRVNNGVLEENGREYWFRKEDDLLEELRGGEFVEAAVIHNQQVSGISIRELEKARVDKKIAITDIQIDGARNIQAAKPDTLVIFMIPPTFDIWLERIHSRGQMPADELKRRLESACKEFEAAFKNDYYRFVLNDTVDGTTAEVRDFAEPGQYDSLKETFARQVAENLYKDTGKYLKTL